MKVINLVMRLFGMLFLVLYVYGFIVDNAFLLFLSGGYFLLGWIASQVVRVSEIRRAGKMHEIMAGIIVDLRKDKK